MVRQVNAAVAAAPPGSFLQSEVLTLKAQAPASQSGFVTIWHPDIPTCSLRFEAGTGEMAAICDDRIWATLLICESERRRLSRGTVVPGVPL